MGILSSLSLICSLFLLRILLRNQKVVIASCLLYFALADVIGNTWILGTALLVSDALGLFVVMRFGLVAAACWYAAPRFINLYPSPIDASVWYASYGYAALAILAVIVFYAFRYSLGGRPLLASSRLDE
jgi:hypothetical protein